MNEVDKAYIERERTDPDPYRETLGSFKELITVIIVVACITALSYVVWGKL
jgi:hypothetical protein